MIKKRATQSRLSQYYGPAIERAIVEGPDYPPEGATATRADLTQRMSSGNVLIASAEAGDGRTTTAVSLALAAARTKPNKRVLLVDLDLRSAGLSGKLGLTKSPGIREIIAGEPTGDALHATAVSNLTVVGCGTAAVDLPESFRAPNFVDFLEEARSQYDLAFFDSPPVKDYVDAKLISGMMDSTILVARWGRSTAAAVSATKRALSGRFVGVLMNRYRNPIPRVLQRYF